MIDKNDIASSGADAEVRLVEENKQSYNLSKDKDFI